MVARIRYAATLGTMLDAGRDKPVPYGTAARPLVGATLVVARIRYAAAMGTTPAAGRDKPVPYGASSGAAFVAGIRAGGIGARRWGVVSGP